MISPPVAASSQELSQRVIGLVESLSAISALNALEIRQMDERTLLQEALSILLKNLDMEWSSVYLCEGTVMVRVAAFDWDTLLAGERGEAVAAAPTIIDDRVMGEALQKRELVNCADCAADQRFSRVPVPDARVPGSLISVPLQQPGGEVLGVLNVSHPQPCFFDDWHERLLRVFAEGLAHLLVNCRLVSRMEREIAQRTEQLMEALMEARGLKERYRELNRELELRVSERTAELEATNRELESFCYSVAHDLRAPLRSIDGFCSILREESAGSLGGDSLACLERIGTSAVRMGALIDDLLELSTVTRREMSRESVDLSALAREVVQTLRAAEPERAVEVFIGEGLSGEGDPRLLRMVFGNLLGNAWKFSGKVSPARIEFGTVVAGGETCFFVRDNGAGFDMAYSGKLFNVFQRLHPHNEYEGTGVGLAIVQRIINRHGGRVWAEGTVGRGATFYFTLPLR